MENDCRPIGVFDSGVGGISVLKELARLMPYENFIYYGDSLNAPYGTKSFEEVQALTFSTAKKLIDRGCKCLVIACNTATAAAVRPLRTMYEGVPVVGIEPALKPAVLSKQNGRVLVLATAVTLHEEKFHRLMSLYEDKADISTLPCPGIVEFVERGITEGEELDDYLRDLFFDYLENPPDSIVLGCTHYPFVKAAISNIFGDGVKIFDGGSGTARETLNQLKRNGLCRNTDSTGTIEFNNSNPDMIDLSKRLFSKEFTEI